MIGRMTGTFGAADGERRCVATNGRGERCRKWAIKGATVCKVHGGSVGRVKAAAQRRLEDQKTRELAQRMDVDVPEFRSAGDAARYLLGRVSHRAAQFGAVADGLGDDLTYTDRAGIERVRAAVAGERAWLDSLARVLAIAAQAEAAGRGDADAVELFTRAVGLFSEDVSAALIDAGIYGEQHEAVMARLRARAGQRLRQSEGMIIEQVRIMTSAGRPREGMG